MSDFLKQLAANAAAARAAKAAEFSSFVKPSATHGSPLQALRDAREATAIEPESLHDSEAGVLASPAVAEGADSIPSESAPIINGDALLERYQARVADEDMRRANARNLWYHPESDSLFETFGPVDEEEVALCDNVTDLVDFEERFKEQQELESIDREREILQGEIIEPTRDLVPADEPEEFDQTLSTKVDADHLRRAAARAAAVFNIMEGVSITPDPSQVNAVHTLAHEQYGCLIGAAGTGKTTTTRMLLHVLMNGDAAAGIEPLRISEVDMSNYHKSEPTSEMDEEERREEDMERALHSHVPSVALCAFTGQATQVLRKNMPGPWKANCMTIHSMLAFKPAEYIKADGTKGWRFEPTYTKYLKMPWDVIVVDEASMVNLELWHQVLDAAKPGCRFYFIGDLNQLPPPIGLGILGFALAKWPVCELTVVHRQSDEAANKIIDTAHAILNGRYDEVVKFDDTKNPNWRVIGYEIDHQASKAFNQIVSIAHGMSKQRVKAVVDPNEPLIYDPWRDRIMTPSNGYNPESPDHMLGQFMLNDALSKVFADPNEPRIVIDCQRTTKKFAVGYRVMATKNESPSEVNRVTNGLTGRIVAIHSNPKWFGDRRLVGEEHEVAENRRRMVLEMPAPAADFSLESADEAEGIEELADAIGANAKDDKLSGPASHIVEVKYDSGAYRVYDLNAEIDQLQIAYASTVHKAQGAEMPTAIIVVHHASKFMLCRENFYTALTRAKERVIVLYTQLGLRIALSKQKISGRNRDEKILSYIKMMGGEDGTAFKQVVVRLTEND